MARWRTAAVRAREEGQGLVGAWLLAATARALNEAKSWTEADAAWEEAAREAAETSRPDAAAQILWQRGTALYNREKGAEEHFSRSLAWTPCARTSATSTVSSRCRTRRPPSRARCARGWSSTEAKRR